MPTQPPHTAARGYYDAYKKETATKKCSVHERRFYRRVNMFMIFVLVFLLNFLSRPTQYIIIINIILSMSISTMYL